MDLCENLSFGELSFETWKVPGKAINGLEAAWRAADSWNLSCLATNQPKRGEH